MTIPLQRSAMTLFFYFLCQWFSISYAQCERIISLSPSITDVLEDLGLSAQLVGKTAYCHAPNAPPHTAIVGSLDQTNIEQLLLLKPSVIFQYNQDDRLQARLQDLNLILIGLPQLRLDDIFTSISMIANFCGIPAQGELLRHNLKKALQTLHNQLPINTVPPRVLILYGADEKIPPYQVYAAGRSFHDDLLQLLGATNAYQGKLNAPFLSQESILALNPDVIIILDQTGLSLTTTQLAPQWPALQQTNALKNQRVYLLSGRDTGIASTRIHFLARAFRQIIYPDLSP